MPACLLVVLLAQPPTAQAATITFDFEGLTEPTAAVGLGDYMSSLYPGTTLPRDVIVGDGRVENGGSHPWISPATSGASGNYVRTAGTSGDSEIYFVDVPIYSIQFDLAVFDDGAGGVFDFDLFAYDATFDAGGGREDPSAAALVFQTSWSDSGPFDMNSGVITFASPVSLIVWSDSGARDVGIDNLIVSTTKPVPEPTAAPLFAVGSLIVGGALRKKAAA
jgi:hypothetical protein